MTIFILIVVFIIIYVATCVHYQNKICKIMNAPLECPPLDNAIKSSKAIGAFLFDRYKAIGKGNNPKKEAGIAGLDMFSMGTSTCMQFIEFIRLCHALGCEVVVRQVGTEDIEDPANTREAFIQIMSHIEDEYWDRQDRKNYTGRYRSKMYRP